MKMKGIKRGKTIELTKELNIPEGQEIWIDIQDGQLTSPEERLRQINEILDNWEGREDFIKTMEELEREKEEQWEKLYGQYS